MNDRLFRVAGALLVAIVAIWAVARIQSSRMIAPSAVGRPPIGQAGSSVDGDLGVESIPQPTKIPDRLPAFSLSDLQGKSTPIASWSGKSLVINFWATWCAPCRREIPLLEGLSGQWRSRGVQVVGIAVDRREAVTDYVRHLKIEYPILIGDQDALDVASSLGFAAPVFPFTVFTDRRGELVTLYVGELHEPQAALILSVVQDLDRDRIVLRQARSTIAAGLQKLGSSTAG